MFELNSLSFIKRLALCIAIPSSALIMYVLWKQNDKSEEEVIDIHNTIRSRQSVIECKVPIDCVRTIIGPQGSVIKEIQKVTNTRINFKDTNPDQDFKTIIIRGSNVNAQKAELEIKRMIAEIPITVTEEFQIPKDYCGKFIGKGGANIKNMSKISGCRITIEKSENFSNEKTQKISVTGCTEQILYAKGLINDFINEEDDFRKKKQISQDRFSKLKQSSSSSIALDCVEQYSIEKPPQLFYPEEFNDEIQIFMSVVANPNVFWIHLINEEAIQFDELIDKMNSYYEKNQFNHYVNALNVGDIVAANNGKGWFRAEVTGIKKSNDKNSNLTNDENWDEDYLVDLFYIDFGDSDYLKKSDIRKLKLEFNQLPCQAIECSLYGIENVKTALWNEDAIHYFENITYSCQWRVLNAKLVSYKTFENDDRNKIPLIEITDPEKNLNIAQSLIDNGHVISCDDKYCNEEKENITIAQCF